MITSILFTASFKLPTRTAKLVSLFVISFANIVLVAQILGLTYALSNHGLWLGLQSLLLFCSWLWWRFKGKPHFGMNLRLSRESVFYSLKHHPALWLLGSVVIISYLVSAFLILYIAPNNNDGLTYHLARVGYWLQFDSIYPWATLNPRQTTFPPNAEFGILWTVLLRGTDQFSGFVQWASALISAVAIFGLGRVLNFTHARSLFPALIYLSLSEVYLQASSVQNDLVIGAFFVSALYLFLLGLKHHHVETLIVSAIAVGLSVGAKSTALFIFPGFAIAVILLWLRDPVGQFRLFLMWGSACLVSIALWGACIYALNIIAFGNPLGDTSFSEDINTSGYGLGEVYILNIPFREITYSRLDMLAINAPRYFTQMLDFTGLDVLGQELTRAKYDIFDQIFANTIIAEAWTRGAWDWYTSKTLWLGAHEDTAWFGPLGFILFLPGLGYGLYLSIRRRDVLPLCIVLMPVIFFLFHSIIQPYTPAKGRYYVLPITVGAVLMIWVTSSQLTVWRVLRWGMIGIAVIITANNVLTNATKPLIGNQAVFGQNRIQLQGDDPMQDTFTDAFENFVPSDAKVVAVSGINTEDFIFWGEYLTRYIVPITLDHRRVFSLEALRYQEPVFYAGYHDPRVPDGGVDYLIIDADVMEKSLLDTDGFEVLAYGINSYLFRALDVVRNTEIDQVRYEFDALTPGNGWHFPENLPDGSGTYRWSSNRNATLGAVRMVAADAYNVQFRVVSYLEESILSNMHLLANDTIIPLQRSPENIFSGTIPAGAVEAQDGLLQLTLSLGDVPSPYELGQSADMRPLGVGVDWLTVDSITIPVNVRAEFDGEYRTSGFYTPEYGDYNFQWSISPTSDITLPVKVESDLQLQFLVRTEITPGSIDNLVVSVNGNVVSFTHEQTQDGVLFTGSVPQFSNSDNLATVTFATIDPVAPQDIDPSSPDVRKLGLAFDWLTIEPVGEQD